MEKSGGGSLRAKLAIGMHERRQLCYCYHNTTFLDDDREDEEYNEIARADLKGSAFHFSLIKKV